MYPGRFATNQHPDYEILGEISRGGMGIVLKARQREIGRLCALKLILVDSGASNRERLLKRLEREAKALAALRHRNVARLFTLAEEAGQPFIVMEFVDGPTLEKDLISRSGSKDLSWLLETFTQLAKALQQCHQKGIVHRDIKASNVLMSTEEPLPRPILVDFGITKSSQQNVEQSVEGLSLSGEIIGTPAYMSPEQIDPKSFGEISPKTDTWGFGTTLYNGLTGTLPFQGANALESFQKICLEDPQAPSRLNPNVPKWLDTLVLYCLQKNPQERPSMNEVVDHLENPRGASPHRVFYGLLLVTLLLALVGLGSYLWPSSQPTKAPVALLEVSKLPDITGKSKIVLEAKLSKALTEFALGDLTGQADEEGRIRCSLTLQEGSNQWTLKARDGQSWQELTTIAVTRDSQKPQLVSRPSFSDTHLVQERQAVTIKVIDSSPTEWREDGRWTPVNSSGTIKLFAKPLKRLRTLLVRDAAGNLSSIRLKIMARNDWAILRQALDDWKIWLKLDKVQKDLFLDWLTIELAPSFEFQGWQAYTSTSERLPIAVFSHKTTSMIFHLIPGGRYDMGSSEKELLAHRRFGLDFMLKRSIKKDPKLKDPSVVPPLILNETPKHSVRVKAFFLAEHECTREEWARLTSTEVKTPQKDIYPRARISWNEIKTSLAKLNGRFRLPSEAEWEFACRATTKTRFYWGDEEDRTHVWCYKNSKKSSHPFTQHRKQRNRFGLIDMLGNMAEWCEDSYIKHYNDGPKNEEARVVEGGEYKVVRGGSWKQGLGICRSSRRFGRSQDLKSGLIGVRLAFSIPKSP